MKPSLRSCSILASALLLVLIPAALAHGHDGDGTMDMSVGMDQADVSHPTISNSTEIGLPSYFRLSEYSGLILAHIVLMSAAWIFILPLSTTPYCCLNKTPTYIEAGVMLSIARSKLGLVAQFSFLVMNGLGVLLATIYNSKTPDLYPNNAHHPLGWFLTWVVCAHTCIAFIHAYTKRTKTGPERVPFIPISTHAMEEHRRIQNLTVAQDYRFSNDSGQGTERNTDSLRSHSMSSLDEVHEGKVPDREGGHEAGYKATGERVSLADSVLGRFLKETLPGLLSSRSSHVMEFVYETINRLILILGFVALTTGIATYGGIFVSITDVMVIHLSAC